jgi:hypothetical protein
MKNGLKKGAKKVSDKSKNVVANAKPDIADLLHEIIVLQKVKDKTGANWRLMNSSIRIYTATAVPKSAY